MIKSRLTSKAQTTIPQAVRAALKLGVGDEIGYTIEDRRVIVTKLEAPREDDPFAAFSEWGSDIDTEAYRDL